MGRKQVRLDASPEMEEAKMANVPSKYDHLMSFAKGYQPTDDEYADRVHKIAHSITEHPGYNPPLDLVLSSNKPTSQQRATRGVEIDPTGHIAKTVVTVTKGGQARPALMHLDVELLSSGALKVHFNGVRVSPARNIDDTCDLLAKRIENLFGPP